MKLILYTDGASRGNPGPAAYGVVLTDTRGKMIEGFGRTLGLATNNEAEYRGLLAGLDAAHEHGATELEIRLDSQLLASQLNGSYKLRAANLKPLHAQAKQKLQKFARVKICYVPRASNRRADALANRALDEAK